MKLAVEKHTHISPISNTYNAILQNGMLFTSYNNKLIVTQLSTLKIIKKLEFDRIECFDVNENYICIASTDICQLGINDFERKALLQASGLVIKHVKMVTVDEKVYVACVTIDNSIYVIDENNNKSTIFKSDSPIEIFDASVRKGLIVICFYNNGEIYEFVGQRCSFQTDAEDIVSISTGENTYTVSSTGIIKDWRLGGSERKYNIRFKHITDMNDKLVCTCDRYMYVFDKKLEFIEKKFIIHEFDINEPPAVNNNQNTSSTALKTNILEEPHSEDTQDEKEASSEMEDDKSYEEADKEEHQSDEGTVTLSDGSEDIQKYKTLSHNKDDSIYDDDLRYIDNIRIVKLTKNLIMTGEHEIFIIGNGLNISETLIGNNDEITDIKEDRDILFIGTNSGRLRYTLKSYYGEGEYVCKAHILEGHTEAIMNIGLGGGYIATTSRDFLCIVWRYEFISDTVKRSKGNASPIEVEKVAVIDYKSIPQTGCAISNNFLFIVGADGILKVWKNFNNIMNIKIHNKDINCIDICETRGLIATGSQDKEFKIMNYNGQVLSSLQGHTKGIMCVSFGSLFVASSSMDRTIRVYSLEDYRCISVLEGHTSYVTCIRFFRNDKYLMSSGSNGLIKIWDVKKCKCELSFSLPSTTIWSLIASDDFIISSDGSLYIYKDSTQKCHESEIKRKEEKQKLKIEMDKSLRSNDLHKLLELAIQAKDIGLIFSTIESLIQKGDFGPLEIFKKHAKLFYEVIVKNSKLKNASTIALLLKYGESAGLIPSKEMEQKLKDICEKHAERIDAVYADLLSLNYFDKR